MKPTEMLDTAMRMLNWIGDENVTETNAEPLQDSDIRAVAKAASVLCLHARMAIRDNA